MINENLKTMIKNKKSFELVQEVGDKYEFPSFEKFMKNYETDGNLNYDGLSGGDVAESKGYGPCASSYCSCSNYELRQQFQQTKEDLDNLWEKFKEYDS